MKNKSVSLHIWGAVFIIFFGGLLHFAYESSGDNFLIGLLTPINESVWEHMKLSFIPMLIFGFYEYFTYFKNHCKNYWFANLTAQLFVILFIIGFYYFYHLFTSGSLFLDIFSFVLGVSIARYLSYLIIKNKIDFVGQKIVSIVGMIILSLIFLSATLDPPKTYIFHDSVTNTYGIYQIE